MPLAKIQVQNFVAYLRGAARPLASNALLLAPNQLGRSSALAPVLLHGHRNSFLVTSVHKSTSLLQPARKTAVVAVKIIGVLPEPASPSPPYGF